MKVPIDRLKAHPKNAEIYLDPQDSAFDDSIRQHGILREIVVNRDFVILDGHRRWVRAKRFGLKEVPVQIREFENETVALIELNRYRVKSPREIYNESKVVEEELKPKARARMLSGRPVLKSEQGRTLKKTAQKLGVGKDKLYKIQKIYDNEKKIPNVVKELDNGKITVHKAHEKLQQAEHKTQPTTINPPGNAENLQSELYPTNVWTLPEKRPKGYGSKDFRGNCDPTIIDQTIRRYLANPHIPKDAVLLDPMAGSGTFIDVAKSLGIPQDKILAFDIQPLRDDIKERNAEKLLIANESVDFIFCHYPYWNMWKYSDHKDDLSNVDKLTFLEKVENTFKEFHRILKKNGYLCVLIGNKRESGILDFEADFSKKGQSYFRLWDKIITIVSDPASHAHVAHGNWGLVLHRAKKNKWTIQTYDTLLVFRKD